MFIRTRRLSFLLPKYELFELGSQLRRSADSVNSKIVEGYGRKRYKKDFVKFLTYSSSINSETTNHLMKLKVLYPKFNKEISELIKEYDLFGGKLYRFIEYVLANWKT